jgi:hypothetical protein
VTGAPKTVPTGVDVAAFLAGVEPERRRRDAERLVGLYREATGAEPAMWGPSIVGFGAYHYRYPSGREGDMAAASFSPRKGATTVYLMDGVDVHGDQLARLGPHTVGKGCVHVRDLDVVNLDVLTEIVRSSYAALTAGTFGVHLSGPSAG